VSADGAAVRRATSECKLNKITRRSFVGTVGAGTVLPVVNRYRSQEQDLKNPGRVSA
jgi:hypothetical protein